MWFNKFHLAVRYYFWQFITIVAFVSICFPAMADPITGTIAAVASTASVALGAYSNYSAGKAKRDQYRYNAAIAANNAIKAEKQAARSAEESRRQDRLERSATLAKYGASGLSSQNASDTLFNQTLNSAKNANLILAEGQQRAENYRQQEKVNLFNAKVANQSANLALVGGGLNLFAQATTSFSSLGGKEKADGKGSGSGSGGGKGSSGGGK